MNPGISRVEIWNRRTSPVEAVLEIATVFDAPAPTAELRGKLTGPRCRYAATVEVAHPLRPLRAPTDMSVRMARVVIPEPALWDTQSPFLYELSLEVWEAGTKSACFRMPHGLREIAMTPAGLRVNGKAFTIRAKRVNACDEAGALGMRREGYNAWLAPACEETAYLWPLADRCGFWLLGDIRETLRPELRARLEQHSSCLGWIAATPAELTGSRALVGVDVSRARGVAAGAAFALHEGHGPVLPDLAHLPAIVSEGSNTGPKSVVILGSVQAPPTC